MSAFLTLTLLSGAFPSTVFESLGGLKIQIDYIGSQTVKASKKKHRIKLRFTLHQKNPSVKQVLLKSVKVEFNAQNWPCMGKANPPSWLVEGEYDGEPVAITPDGVEIEFNVAVNHTCRGYEGMLWHRFIFEEVRNSETLSHREKLDVPVTVN